MTAEHPGTPVAPDLLPCPFCGRQPQHWPFAFGVGAYYGFRCCVVDSGRKYHTQAEAFAGWNRRAALSAAPLPLEPRDASPVALLAEAAYQKACKSSQPEDWFEAALLLRQAAQEPAQSLPTARDRSAFEKTLGELHPSWTFDDDGTGGYHNPRTEAAWQGWQEALKKASPKPPHAEPVAPTDGQSLWLWKNGDHFLAFTSLYPCFSPGGDPMTLGEPVGRAVFRESHKRGDASC